MIVKEFIAYYLHNSSSVLCTFLDGSKSFDRVHYCMLFKLIISRQVPACIVRVLINFYTSNYVRVSWCGILSEYFFSRQRCQIRRSFEPCYFLFIIMLMGYL